jgi:hypothetical protein
LREIVETKASAIKKEILIDRAHSKIQINQSVVAVCLHCNLAPSMGETLIIRWEQAHTREDKEVCPVRAGVSWEVISGRKSRLLWKLGRSHTSSSSNGSADKASENAIAGKRLS